VGGASELTALGAGDLARGIAARRFSSTEVVSAFIDRQNEVQPRLNAVAVALHDQAVAAAKAADRSRPQDGQKLYGVPVTVKECFDVVGTATTAGLVGRAADLKSDDAELVSRLRNAGAIITAKSNLAQLELFVESDNPLYGRTNNPWDLARTPGGSSGGEAALVAASATPLGLGTDIGGSVRVPAHFCGVCGLRATPGKLSLAGTADQMLFGHIVGVPDAAGPIARTVADLRLAMEVLAAPVAEARVDGPPEMLGGEVPLPALRGVPDLRRDHDDLALVLERAREELLAEAPRLDRGGVEVHDPLGVRILQELHRLLRGERAPPPAREGPGPEPDLGDLDLCLSQGPVVHHGGATAGAKGAAVFIHDGGDQSSEVRRGLTPS